jgi:hypothetical protein
LQHHYRPNPKLTRGSVTKASNPSRQYPTLDYFDGVAAGSQISGCCAGAATRQKANIKLQNGEVVSILRAGTLYVFRNHR